MKITYIKKERGWIWRAYLPDPKSGGRKDFKSKQFPTKRGAEQDAEAMLKNYLGGGFALPSKTTFEQLATQWLRAKRGELSKKSTNYFYNQQVNSLNLYFSKVLIQDISPLMVQDFYSTLKEQDKPLSSGTINHYSKTLKTILKFAVQMKMLNNNPAEGVRPPKTHKTQINPWTRAEFILFYNEIKDHRLFAFYRLSAYTGARRGELLALRKSDIDFTKQEMTISKTRGLAGAEVIEDELTKTDLPRTISIDEETCQILKEHFKKMTLELSSSPFPLQGSDYVFTQEDGSPIYPSTPSSLFSKVSRKVGLRPQRLHDLRHFHATELIRSGFNLLDIQFRLGHTTLEMTMGTYGHLRPEDKSRIAEHFAKVMNIN